MREMCQKGREHEEDADEKELDPRQIQHRCDVDGDEAQNREGEDHDQRSMRQHSISVAPVRGAPAESASVDDEELRRTTDLEVRPGSPGDQRLPP